MKKALVIAASVLAVTLSTGCATGAGGTAGDYAMGDDAAAVKRGRNRASARLSQAELEQHRRQRANAAEEAQLDAIKRRQKQEEINGTLGTVNNVISTIRNLRWGW